MKIIRFKNREAINRNRKNKGAISAEYILVAVCVALFAMWGLRNFGGVLTKKLNDTAATVGAVTNKPDDDDTSKITTSGEIGSELKGGGGSK